MSIEFQDYTKFGAHQKEARFKSIPESQYIQFKHNVLLAKLIKSDYQIQTNINKYRVSVFKLTMLNMDIILCFNYRVLSLKQCAFSSI